MENKTTMNRIKTFAIIRADSEPSSLPTNETHSAILDRYAFCFFNLKEKDCTGDEFLIFNLTLADAMSIAERFYQQSFVFVATEGDLIEVTDWKKKSERSEVFSKSETATCPIETPDFSLTVATSINEYSYEISPCQLSACIESVNDIYSNNCKISEAYCHNFEKNLESSLDKRLTFMGRVSARTRLKNI